MPLEVKRGEMYYANLDPVVGSEQNGFRPVLIIQNDKGNYFSPTVVVAAITGKSKKTNMPTHYLIPAENGLETPSVALCEQIRTIDKSRLETYIGTLDEISMKGIDRAIAVSITHETRRESYNIVLKTLTERQRIVLQILWDGGNMTAQEAADELFLLDITPTNERNFAAPRLTELCDMGLVKAVGKKICAKTGRNVTVWSAAKEDGKDEL